jgi:uncharacterized protein YdeI (YjbR/CyaY-like superfamily)
MSDIVEARELIELAQRMLERAHKMMTREPPARKKAAPKQIRITEAIRTQVKTLAAEGSKTNHQIAEIVGLRNAGRVSDILHGKR